MVRLLVRRLEPSPEAVECVGGEGGGWGDSRGRTVLILCTVLGRKMKYAGEEI